MGDVVSPYKISRAICFWIFVWSLISVVADDDGRFWGALMVASVIGFALFDWQMFWELKRKGDE